MLGQIQSHPGPHAARRLRVGHPWWGAGGRHTPGGVQPVLFLRKNRGVRARLPPGLGRGQSDDFTEVVTFELDFEK